MTPDATLAAALRRILLDWCNDSKDERLALRRAIFLVEREAKGRFYFDMPESAFVAWEDWATSEIEALRAEVESSKAEYAELQTAYRNGLDLVVAERGAALAEVERLRHELRRPEIADENNMVMTGMWECAIEDGEAWRACADQLAHELRRHSKLSEALAVYERLRRGEILDRMSEHAEEQGLS